MKKVNSMFAEHRVSKIRLMIYRLPSLATVRNLKRIVAYNRKFGFKITFKEINKKLWMDNYYLYAGIKSIARI
jgi:hypothetical protein